MNVKRFFGQTSKDALSQVKKILGRDAIILSNRSVDGGHEIMAFKEEDMQALIQDEMHEDGLVATPSITEAPPAPKPQMARPIETVAQEGRPDFTLPDSMRPDMGKKEPSPQAAPRPAMNRPATAKPASSINDAFKSIDAQQQAAPTVAPAQPQVAAQNKALSAEELVRAATGQSQPNTQAPQEKPALQANNTPTPDSSEAEMAAMIDEMRQMRSSFESKIQQQQTTPLKPLEQLPRELNKAPLKAPQAPAQPQQHPQMQEMLSEMRNMRSSFESQLTSLNWANIAQRSPLKSKILNLLLSARFSATLSRQLAEKLPDSFQGLPMTEENAIAWTKHILMLNLDTPEHENTMLDQGGVFALVGPTGVGKTTTTAKLAARYVMKHGTENLGLITTDAYRVGGHEQLRIYGKILGVMVHAVKDETDLKIALNELKNKHTVLIDTVGMSQKDRMVADQMAMLSSTQRRINKLLCVNATSTGATLSDVVRAYKGKGLDGAILTKIDEAATIGNALDIVIRNKLKLYFATNGQRVPEDIIHSDKDVLVNQAFNFKDTAQYPYEFLEDELPFIMGQSALKQPSETSGA